MPKAITSIPATEQQDPFASAGEQARAERGDDTNGDAEIVALFRRWLDQSRVIDELTAAADPSTDSPELDEAYDQRVETKKAIFACPGGPLGLAIKVFLVIKTLSVARAPEAAQVRITVCDDHDHEMYDWAESVLRDAAALVPEIGECAAAVLHDDAPLISADMDIQWATSVLAEEAEAEEWPWVQDALRQAFDTVARSIATTARGQAIQLRALASMRPAVTH